MSISLVIVGHAYQGASQEGTTVPVVWRILGNAALGVEVFFVISGYLITSLLLSEMNRTGTIELHSFYIRRSFRIIPALWAYLLCTVILYSIGAISGITRCSFLSALMFVTNYSGCSDAAALAHTWSLSVEEQFYLLWPGALWFVLARRGRPAAAMIALTLILLAPFLRIVTYSLGNEFLRERLYYMLHTRVDSLMFGCLAALTFGTAAFESAYDRLRRLTVPLVIFVLVASPIITARFGGAYIYTVGYTLEGGAIALAMVWLVRNPASYIGKLLNTKAITHVGLISYSLYLWQELMLKTDLAIARVTVIALGATFLAAELSYRVIEVPFLRLRTRFQRL